MSDTAHQVRALLAEVCAVDADAIQPETSLIQYGLDSARAIDLVVALEEAFAVRISDEAAAKMKTLGDIVTFIEGSRKP